MAQYHLFLKFLATKHCFGNYWRSTTFSGTRAWWARVPYFLIHRGTMTWKARIKIFCLVLEHLKLEYCWTVLKSYKLEYRLFIYCTPLKWTKMNLNGKLTLHEPKWAHLCSVVCIGKIKWFFSLFWT